MVFRLPYPCSLVLAEHTTGCIEAGNMLSEKLVRIYASMESASYNMRKGYTYRSVRSVTWYPWLEEFLNMKNVGMFNFHFIRSQHLACHQFKPCATDHVMRKVLPEFSKILIRRSHED